MPNLAPDQETTTLHSKDLMHLPEICAYCAHYGWKYRPSGGWAYCFFNGTWFPLQNDERIEPAGTRACEHWKHTALKEKYATD